MDNQSWNEKLAACAKAFSSNNFDTLIANSAQDAADLVLAEMSLLTDGTVISYGDSLTLRDTGILEVLKGNNRFTFLDGFSPERSREENLQIRREALLSDIFLVGTNAITMEGQLVNLDMIGNRIAPIVFGPSKVYVFVGRNKLVDSVGEAMDRIRNYAAPQNAIRHPKFKTPCQQTATCHNCKSPDRICNAWLITEKSFPKGRITVVFINQDLGL